jgi:GTP-binding protein
VPNLGVVRVGEESSFVVADIPGLIEGAADGVGLGIRFLRHVERCRLLVHMVDIASTEGRDPIDDFEKINAELAKYTEKLAQKPQLVVGNKVDAIYDEELADKFRDYVKKNGYEYVEISAATRTGIDELIAFMWDNLKEQPEMEVFESEYVPEINDEPSRTVRI